MDEVAKKLREDVIQEVFENQVMPLSIDLQTRLMQYGNAAQQSVQRTRAYCECKKPIEFLYGDIYYCKVCNRPCR